MIVAISILFFLSAAVLAWAMLPDMSSRMIRKRVMSQVAQPKRVSVLVPMARALEPLHARLPLTGYGVKTTQLLEAAGLHMPPMQFLVLQEMGLLTGVMLYFATLGGESFNMVWFALFAMMGFLVPGFWVRNRIKQRRQTVQRDLPEIVDLLTLAVSAGSDFMSALNRIVREFRPCPVREELGVVLQEIGVGKRRRDALRGFADRVRTPEASTFARTIIQVDRMGTGMSEALSILSEDMRIARYNWAERYAQQAPMKMLIPLMLSLGAAMVIVAGPIFIKFFRGGLMTAPNPAAAHQQGA